MSEAVNSPVPTISTGEPSTLATYLKIAKFMNPRVAKFIQQKINESPNGENEVVIADEGQMLYLIATL